MRPTLDSRSLDQRVTIQVQSTSQDGAGQPVPAWTTLAQAWASILHKTGSETIKADQDTSTVQASVRIRSRSDVTAGMRVVHGSAIYEIRAVLPNARRAFFIDLVCALVN